MIYDIHKLISYIKKNRNKYLSPGVMGNPPDRLDGFHSYNACCRSSEDKGRSEDNMATYTQDRRAYEYWSDGNYYLANGLMGQYRKDRNRYNCPKCGKNENMSADHIGPISLGFSHRAKFNPMCSSCNSSKNNRLTYSDVYQLLEDEKYEKVVSWHSKPIWDSLKTRVKDDNDAVKLSRFMGSHMQNVLYIFSEIYLLKDEYVRKKGEEFLIRYLENDYPKDYKFENFNPFNLSQLKITEKVKKRSNQERKIRVAFESIVEFKKKENRKTKLSSISFFENEIFNLIDVIEIGDYEKADLLLLKLINISAETLSVQW
jgi:Alw26I/Eco31I/Esp3I family type II restriction endonuclease